MKFYYLIILLLIRSIFATCQGVEYITPDDYPVTNRMLADCINENKNEKIFPLEEAWFKNIELNEVLIFELYTDYHRIAICHSKSDFLLSDIVEYRGFRKKQRPWVYKHSPEDLAELQKIYELYQNNACEIDKSNFKTYQGLKLGMSKSETLKRFGKPDYDTLVNEIEILEWDYTGDIWFQEMNKPPKGRIAKNSFGYHISMLFNKDKLSVLILENDIP